jgi:hypothetical protein
MTLDPTKEKIITCRIYEKGIVYEQIIQVEDSLTENNPILLESIIVPDPIQDLLKKFGDLSNIMSLHNERVTKLENIVSKITSESNESSLENNVP